MNDSFDATRFLTLMRHNLRYRGPLGTSVGWSSVWMSLCPTAFILLMSLTNDMRSFYAPEMRLLCIAMWAITTGMFCLTNNFSLVGRRSQGRYFALLPASKGEKYWSLMLIASVVVPMITVGLSLVVELMMSLTGIAAWQQPIWDIEWISAPTGWELPIVVVLCWLTEAATLVGITLRSPLLRTLLFLLSVVWMAGIFMGLDLLPIELNPTWMHYALILAVLTAMTALIVLWGKYRMSRMTY